MARGLAAGIVRALPYDDRDVADEKKQDPTTIVEADLQKIPQNGDAIILAAAASTESAAEALYADDHEWHGAFSRALFEVLRSNLQTLSADDVVAAVSSVLHADPLPFQQPSVEGRTRESLFGSPVPAHALHVHAVKVSGTSVTLDLGSAAAFDAGTQFTAADPDTGGQKIVLEVLQIDEPLVSTARIVNGPAVVKVGQIFELTRLNYPRAARLTIFTPDSEPDPVAAFAEPKRYIRGSRGRTILPTSLSISWP